MKRRKAKAREAILDVLSDGEWWYALSIMRKTKLRAGRAYAALTELENEGIVEAEFQPGPPPRRRLYRMRRSPDA